MAYMFKDSLPPEPFVAFVQEVIDSCGGNYNTAGARLGADSSNVAKWSRGLNSAGKPMSQVRLERVDRCTTAFGGPTLYELYPELEVDDVVLELHCPTCEDSALVGSDRVCPWCDTAIPENRFRCSGCGGPKWRDAVRCHKCANGGRKTTMHISESLLHVAYLLYQQDGLSVPEVAERVFLKTEYASLEACAACLRNSWKTRGWELRTSGESNHLKNGRARPRCRHIGVRGKFKGQQCDRRDAGSGYCSKHNREQMKARLAVLNGRRDAGRAAAREPVAA